ncbi:MAG TPA: sporulation membrane protein YtaF [Desulfotomaculum sp.]|nr:sporulation membrane protein YtaF [Desulfotomaculum sp.]
MDLFAILLLVIAANLDNLGVGISLRIRRIRVPFSSNLLIAFTTSSGTLLTLIAGKWLASFISPELAKYTGALVIIATGVWVLYEELCRAGRKAAAVNPAEAEYEQPPPETAGQRRLTELLTAPSLADVDHSGHIDLKEALLLGMALALNNFAAGLGAGVFGLNPLLTAFTVSLFSLFLLWLGIGLGQNCMSRWLGDCAGPVAGLLLVLLGFFGIII